ncbi:MAG: hypothetical protein ABIS67_09015 [Candidatus Eisenbacteria bacterium]
MTNPRAPATTALLLAAAGALFSGCSTGPEPQIAAPPPVSISTGPSAIVAGASDSVGSLPGSAGALYRYRFKQVDPPSDRFTFQDRELNFYFRPSPDALHFQIENRQDRPVEIDWDRCLMTDPWGKTEGVAHGTTRWNNRFSAQAPTTVLGLQRFGDYLLPMSYLVDPVASGEQLHRPLFPEDTTAPQYTDKEVAVTLMIRIEGQLRSYSFRFRAASVIPR